MSIGDSLRIKETALIGPFPFSLAGASHQQYIRWLWTFPPQSGERKSYLWSPALYAQAGCNLFRLEIVDFLLFHLGKSRLARHIERYKPLLFCLVKYSGNQPVMLCDAFGGQLSARAFILPRLRQQGI